FPQLADGDVHAMLKIDKVVLRPEARAQPLARDDFTSSFEQQLQYRARLSRQGDARAALPQDAGTQLQLIRAEAIGAYSLRTHGGIRAQQCSPRCLASLIRVQTISADSAACGVR